MKIYLNMSGPLSPLTRHFNLEGETVTSHKEEADLILDDPFVLPEFFNESSKDGTKSDVSNDLSTVYVLTRYYNVDHWTDQILVGIPLFGLMNNNLGPRVCVGSAFRYLKPIVESIEFDKYTLALQELGFQGFVSLLFNDTGDFISAQTSIPFYGLFGVLEGVRGKLGEWFADPNRLYESWVVSLLLTSHPWPNTSTVVDKVKVIPNVSKEIEKHFWSFPRSQQSQGLLGIATAWAGIEDDSVNGASGSLERANNFALRTAGSIDVPEKQYRTDLAIRVREKWIDLKNRGLV